MWNSQRTGAPDKIKTPRKSPEKWTFLSLAFYNAPSLPTVGSKCSLDGFSKKAPARVFSQTRFPEAFLEGGVFIEGA